MYTEDTMTLYVNYNEVTGLWQVVGRSEWSTKANAIANAKYVLGSSDGGLIRVYKKSGDYHTTITVAADAKLGL